MGTPAPVWLDGTLVPAASARVSVFDHGLTVGDGVFETLRVDGGVPFAPRRHLDRLARSAAGLGLPVPSRPVLLGAMAEVVEASGDVAAGAARLRITVTGGASPLGSGRGDGPPTVVVAISPLPPWPAAATVALAPWPRNERAATAGLKTTSYADNVVALAYAARRGADEAVLPNTLGNLCEGTGTNVFVALDGRLVTPPLSSGCLAGVTRELVLACCPVPVEEADVPLGALASADEAFLTSTTREVQPVAAVDGRPLAAAPGPLTAAAAAAFADLRRSTPDP